jgi:TldD protein
LLTFCLAKGGDFADLYFEYKRSSSLFFEDNIVKSATHGIVQGVGIRVIKDDRIGFAFSETLTMEKMLEAAQIAAIIADDPTARVRVIPLKEIQLRNLYPVVELATEAELSKKFAFVKEANETARNYSPKIVKVSCNFSDAVRYLAYANSDGLAWTDSQPVFLFSVNCLAEEGKNRQSGYDSVGGKIGLEYFATIRRPSDIATESARLAVLNLSARNVEAGLRTVVLGPADSGVLLHEAVGHGLEADFNRKNLSNYSGRIGEKVASELCTIVDEGFFEHMRGSINIDDEGNLPTATVLIENGILKGYLHDRVSAMVMKASATGNGRRQDYSYVPMPRMTNTYMRAGEYDPAEIISSVKKGIYAKRFSGGYVDINKGDFTFTVLESYLIEDGKLTTPLKGVTLIGNGPDIMTKITMVGNDLRFSEGGWICGKLGQLVPVGIGIPTCKISQITVGGEKIK